MTMHTETGPISPLSDHESWDLLSGRSLGRLAVSVDGQPDVFPVNYAVQRHTIVLRTAEGTKLAAATINQRVAFEVDDHGLEEGWSVVVKGRAEVVTGSAELAEAERAQVFPWTSTVKHRFVRIIAEKITGRRFRFGGTTL